MGVLITNVIYNDPATIVFWSDKTKTVVKAQAGETFDPEKGLAMAIAKRCFGNEGNYYNVFDKWLPKKKDEECVYPKIELGEDTQKMMQEAVEKLKILLNKKYGEPKKGEKSNEAGNC
jgi:hypothetical protein